MTKTLLNCNTLCILAGVRQEPYQTWSMRNPINLNRLFGRALPSSKTEIERYLNYFILNTCNIWHIKRFKPNQNWTKPILFSAFSFFGTKFETFLLWRVSSVKISSICSFSFAIVSIVFSLWIKKITFTFLLNFPFGMTHLLFAKWPMM